LNLKLPALTGKEVRLIHTTAFAVVSTAFLVIVNVVASDLILTWSFPRGGESPVPWPLIVLAAWLFLTILWICGLIACYMMHIVKTNRISGKRKVLWAVLILLAHIFVMPVYWHLFIRPEPTTDS
jgi:hypothetical protein